MGSADIRSSEPQIPKGMLQTNFDGLILALINKTLVETHEEVDVDSLREESCKE